ncbi:hypothetical protein BDV32DRAFT_123519 [Aspergillus pseudonomiae]|nr:hypothetical protein BDV32DRAFT_123519 [Aspergillus pseudonomiae]
MQTKRKRCRLSSGGRWTTEERLRLLRLRDLNKHLRWTQFQKTYFPRRSYMALTKAYSDMKLNQQTRGNAMTNTASNGTTLPFKTNKPNKRPNTDERSVNERANKQSKTAEKDSTYAPDEDGEGSEFSFGGDIDIDGGPTSPVNGRTRSSANSLAKNNAQAARIPLISQNRRIATSSQTSVSDKTAPESPSRTRQAKGTERVLGAIHNSKPVSTTAAMQSISLPKANPSNPPSKASQPPPASTQIESLGSGTAHDLWSSLVKSIADHKKSYELLPKFAERQGSELIKWALLDLISDAHSYQSAQQLIAEQTRELDTYKKGQESLEAELSKANGEIDTYKKSQESLEATLSKARGEIAKLDQQLKSSQSQSCKECRRLQERNTALEETINIVKRQLLSGPAERRPPPSSSTSAGVVSG